MSKKKTKKGAKKPNPEVETCTTKTRMQVILKEYINTESLTLSQQQLIISSLSLSNHSLYDSMVIDIITDFLRFAKQIKLSPLQTEPIYCIFQRVLYKIKNDQNIDLRHLTSYLNNELSLRIKAETPNNNDETTQYISSDLSEKVVRFIKERILSQYELYRIALFENNPSNIQYAQFKKQFKIGDIVRFQDTECVFQIQEFRPNDIILNCLHSDFKSLDAQNENDTNTIKYNISRDQLRFLSFVSKPQKDDEIVIVDNDDKENNVNNENEDTTNQDKQIKVENIDEKELNSDKNKVDAPKTLIDIIVDRKIQDKLELMQQKFDQELEQYKQQIEKLKNP